MRTLDRYVLREWTKIFLVSALGVPLVPIIFDLTDNLDKYMSRGLHKGAIFLAYVYALPETIYLVQRAPEVGDHPLQADGICQRGEGRAPWTPDDGFFLTFVDPDVGLPRTLRTDAKGDGRLEFHHRAASIAAGTTFDVQMRLIDNETAPTTELRSGCMTVFVK